MVKLRRTEPPKNIQVFINYYDVNKAQRWGALIKDHKNYVIVEDVVKERTKVNKEKIIRTIEKEK